MPVFIQEKILFAQVKLPIVKLNKELTQESCDSTEDVAPETVFKCSSSIMKNQPIANELYCHN